MVAGEKTSIRMVSADINTTGKSEDYVPMLLDDSVLPDAINATVIPLVKVVADTEADLLPLTIIDDVLEDTLDNWTLL
jgi:hypothetical protein